MKITGIETFLMHAGPVPADEAIARPELVAAESTPFRNWLFLKVHTDEGIYGVGECSGWPRVVETAIHDIAPSLIGEDPFDIERISQMLIVGEMSHGMTGTVGSGAMAGIDMALWDIKGKALGTPVWNLLGGKMRDRIRVYGGAATPERALELKDRGLTAVKTGGIANVIQKVDAIRKAVGDEMDIAVDVHGLPWFTTKDAIIIGKALEPYNLLFYEDPVPPEDIEAMARVQDNVDIPIAAGERLSHIWGVRPLIEREIVDVLQPDPGRIGGITPMKKMAAMAEAHYIMMAPHDGTLGPIAEYAAIHLLASIPNALIMERQQDDVTSRYEVVDPVPTQVDGFVLVPDQPGLGVDIVEDAIARYPSRRNFSVRGDVGNQGAYEPGTVSEHVYVQQRYHRQRALKRLR